MDHHVFNFIIVIIIGVPTYTGISLLTSIISIEKVFLDYSYKL